MRTSMRMFDVAKGSAVDIASMVVQPSEQGRSVPGTDVFYHAGMVTEQCRQALLGHAPATIWLTGLSGAGKSTLAYALEAMLLDLAHPCFVLDGDNLRHGLSKDLGFSAPDRRENIRRTAEVARIMNEAGLIVITALISPFRDDRKMARTIIGDARFVEVHVSTLATVCEQRDPKGLYVRARAGQLAEFTGISSPYETPLIPDLVLDTDALPLKDSTQTLLDLVAKRCFK